VKVAYVGIHEYDIPPHDPRPTFVWGFATGALWQAILAMVKMSVLLFLLRLGGTKTGVRIAIWTLLVLNAVSAVVILLVYTFICSPQDHGWQIEYLGGHCPQKTISALFGAAWMLLTDVLVLALPFWIFIGLRMAMRAKIAVIGVFVLGFT